MLIPSLLPGDIAAGHFGRLVRWGGFRSREAATRALKRHVAALTGEPPDYLLVHLLARATKISLRDFCRRHTMLPFTRAFTIKRPDLAHGDVAGASFTRSRGLSFPQPGVFGCARCIEEDLEFWGYAYFRREHQLPYVILCGKHDEALFWKRGANAAMESPLLAFRSPDELGYVLDPSFCDHPVVSRYRVIAEALLGHEKPISLARVQDVVCDRAKLLGLRCGEDGRRPALTDLAVKTCPRPWLDVLVENLRGNSNRGYRSSLDHTFATQTLSGQSWLHVLGMSLVFDTAEDALNAVATNNLHNVRTTERFALGPVWVERSPGQRQPTNPTRMNNPQSAPSPT